MDKVTKAFIKLPLRDKLVFLLVFIAVMVGAMALLLKLSMAGITAEYPTSTLALVGDAQTHEDFSYDDLPERVAFPGTGIGVSVGGKEGTPTGCGTSFEYDDDITLVTFVVDGSFRKTVEKYFPEILGTKKFSGYDSKVSAKGYMNTYKLEYEAGALKCTDANYHMVSYVYGDVGISAVTKDRSRIKDAKKILDRMATTFGDVYATKDTESEPDKEEAAVTTKKGEDEGLRDRISDETRATELMEESAYEKNHADEGPLTCSRDVGEELAGKDVVFVFYYMNVMSVPKSAVIISPSGQRYEAYYKNSGADGEVRFKVENAEKGTWTAELSNNVPYGGYDMYVMSQEGWNEASIPNSLKEEPTPRGADD